MDARSETTSEIEPIPFSNSIRLTGGQWIGAAIFMGLLMGFASPSWKYYEKFDPEPDYRIPHQLSEDYWLFERLADLAAQRDDTVVVGDSVVWGIFATPHETLSHYLSQSGPIRFTNLGLEGADPLALAGLIEHHAAGITGKNVVVQFNPLWLTSPERDLSDDSDKPFNHSRLVPQFLLPIPRYKADINVRLGILVEQRLTLNQWRNHVQLAFYGSDLHKWTIDKPDDPKRHPTGHPYENPFEPLTHNLPQDKELWHEQLPWYISMSRIKEDFPWIDLETSLQWHAFQRVIDLLQQRNNRVFVVVGPFNEHMLTEASLERYQTVKKKIAAWLAARQIPHMVPDALPSEEYGDSSHPLPKGYARLAERLLADPNFEKGRK